MMDSGFTSVGIIQHLMNNNGYCVIDGLLVENKFNINKIHIKKINPNTYYVDFTISSDYTFTLEYSVEHNVSFYVLDINWNIEVFKYYTNLIKEVGKFLINNEINYDMDIINTDNIHDKQENFYLLDTLNSFILKTVNKEEPILYFDIKDKSKKITFSISDMINYNDIEEEDLKVLLNTFKNIIFPIRIKCSDVRSIVSKDFRILDYILDSIRICNTDLKIKYFTVQVIFGKYLSIAYSYVE